MNKETIVAIATPSGRGGVGVIRVSGIDVSKIAQKILGFLPKPRQATYVPFCNRQGDVIDQGLAIYFPGPRSFTGEDVLEFHGHGGPVILDYIVNEIVALGARPARPGEFSERAFLNDKIDLAQAEAIADLIDASSELAARSAVRSLQGHFSNQIKDVVEKLVQLRLFIEAAIDFPTEEIDFINESTVQQDLAKLIKTITDLRESAHQGSLLREGMTAVIVGKPNAGKSSLLNVLSGKDSAIVTDVPGTTRDVIKEFIQIDGLPLHILDTAGLRETEDVVEREGMRRTHTAVQQADVILWIIDSTVPLEEIPNLNQNNKTPLLIIRNKIDLLQESPSIDLYQGHKVISISAKFNQGLETVREHLKQLIGFNPPSEGLFIARRRHLNAIDQATQSLYHGLNHFQEFQKSELLAEDLRQAQIALNEITGEFSADDLLGKIFSSFCIGK